MSDKPKNAFVLVSTVMLSLLALPAIADEAEDSSSAFQADLARIAAERGIAEPVVTTDENGVSSAVVGIKHLRMLAVRTNDDGSVSYGHVSDEKDMEEFVASDISDEQAPEE